jgi:hypothetical protein
MPSRSATQSGSTTAVGSSSAGPTAASMSEDEDHVGSMKGKSRSTSAGMPNLTSGSQPYSREMPADISQAARHAGRESEPGTGPAEIARADGTPRCEPSPLVPPTHPDAAKLPCARCRRFALECVRVKIQKRKGPPPVDLRCV